MIVRSFEKRKKIGKKERYKFALSSITIVCRLEKLNSYIVFLSVERGTVSFPLFRVYGVVNSINCNISFYR